MSFRWSEEISISNVICMDAEPEAYEVLYGFGFDTWEEAERFGYLLSKNEKFKCLIDELAEEVCKE